MVNFRDFCKFLVKFAIFRWNFHGILSELQENSNAKQFREIQKKLQKFAKFYEKLMNFCKICTIFSLHPYPSIYLSRTTDPLPSGSFGGPNGTSDFVEVSINMLRIYKTFRMRRTTWVGLRYLLAVFSSTGVNAYSCILPWEELRCCVSKLRFWMAYFQTCSVTNMFECVLWNCMLGSSVECGLCRSLGCIQ